jgi:cytochrome c oxidase subunit 3
MAWGVRCAQLSQQRGLQICLALTLVCAMGFLGIKYVEYKAKFEHGLLWGQRFKPTEHLDKDGHIVHDSHEGGAGEHAGAADAGHGGEHGGGQPAIPAAPPMVGGTKAVPPGVASSAAPKTPSPSSPVATTDPGQAALSATENPRIAQQPVAATTTPVVPSSASKTGTAAPTASSPNPASPASGADPTPPIKVEEISLQPSNVQIFFGIYFCMTGLHAIHILVGIGLITWLLVRSIKGEFTDGYYTPVDLIGLYWHIVDMIWIYLFPLLYLIH